MTTDAEREESSPGGLWLNLSGGRFRAAIFHYGCMRRLHEAGLLRRVVGISATSGGAIVAALWAMHCRLEMTRLRDERHQAAVPHAADSVDVAGVIQEAAWEPFERDLLALVRRGALGPTGLVVVVICLYACAVALSFVDLVAQEVAIAFLVLGFLVAAVALHVALLALLLGEGALRRAAWTSRNLRLKSPRSAASPARRSARVAIAVALVHDGPARLPWLPAA